MSLENHKITTYEDNVASLPDYPSDAGYTAAKLKDVFDGRTNKEIKKKFNALIDELISTIAKLEAADEAVAQNAEEHTDTSVSSHNTSENAHSDIRTLISELTRRLNALADSDDTTLDQLSELVAYIKDNRSLIDSVTTAKANKTDVYTKTAVDEMLEKIGTVIEEAESSMDAKLERYVKKADFSSAKGISMVSTVSSEGTTYTPTIFKATTTDIKGLANQYRPIVPANLEYAVEYTNSKLGMASKAYVNNAVTERDERISRIEEKILELSEALGDIDSLLDETIASCDEYIGGEVE